MDLRKEFRNLIGPYTPTLNRIIVINIAVFLVANLYASFSNSAPILDYLTLPASFSEFIRRPWTIITYMFLHIGFMHILFNMLWLYWMGRIFAEYMGEKRLLYTYIIGGICGGLLFMLVYGVAFPQNDVLLGASAGIMAVIIAIAGLLPNYEMVLLLIGPVKLKYIAAAAFILSSLVDFSVNSGGKVSHIGGALYGLLFIWQYKKGNDIAEKASRVVTGVTRIFKPKKRKAKLKATYGGRSVSDKQRRIDDILDKISKSGYESLTKDEKDFLFKSSKEN